MPFRTRNIAVCQKLFKTFSIFGSVNTVNTGAKYFHACICKRSSQIDCRLAAKLYDNAFRLFFIKNIQNIFYCQRFKIQTIRSIKVRTYSFRVIVNNDGFISKLFQCPYGMYRAIVKLYALTNANWPRTKYYYRFFT